jgi:hypothetical protein
MKEMKWNPKAHSRLAFHSETLTPYPPVAVDRRLRRCEAEVFRAIGRREPGGESRRRDGDQCCSRFEGSKNSAVRGC